MIFLTNTSLVYKQTNVALLSKAWFSLQIQMDLRMISITQTKITVLIEIPFALTKF